MKLLGLSYFILNELYCECVVGMIRLELLRDTSSFVKTGERCFDAIDRKKPHERRNRRRFYYDYRFR